VVPDLMGSKIPSDEEWWARTPEGQVILRLIEDWEAGITEHGDIALSFTSITGNDPDIPSGAAHRSQFICTQQDARQIAHTILRTLAFAQTGEDPDFTAFKQRIQSPALREVARHWNKARGKRRMPGWDDLNPDCIAPQLGRVWGFDYDRTTGSFIGRLAGRNVLVAFGKTFLGTPLSELHQPHVFEKSHANFLRVISEPACVRWSGRLFKMDDQIIEGERLILPMGDENGGYGVLGASDFGPPPLRTPARFELLHDIADWYPL
jgi:hypothetical protein